jgi:large subunit ribosomal protein L33
MAKKGPRATTRLKSTKSAHVYYTTKNSRNTTEKLKLRKFDPTIKQHCEFVEEKMK